VKASRGAAVPETAIVLGVCLTLLFGTFELGLIGLMQLGGDGAAFLAAHASVLGNDPQSAIAAPFPQIARDATVSVQQSEPDATSVDVDYNVSQQSNRHGGAQVVRPTHTQATVTNAGVGIGAILPKTSLSSGVIEANMMVSGVGFELDGNPYNSAADFAKQKSYFSDDGNAPPYHIGFRFLYHCVPSANAGCPAAASQTLYAAGFAEYLDGDNWNRGQPGVQPGGVYEAMMIHQQVYARIAQHLAAMSYPNGNADHTTLDPNPATSPDGCMPTVNNWDIGIPPGYTIGTTSIGTYPLNPLGNNPGCF
jgi:Flp pilus assembly protein TadG